MLNEQNIVDALNTVLRGVQVAQKRGAFTLEESATLYEAIQLVVNGTKNVPNPTPAPPMSQPSEEENTENDE